MKTKRNLTFALGMVASVLIASSVSAVTYTEVGDAGQSLGTAQSTGPGNLALTQIFGSLLSATDVDIFAINITDFTAFSASTVNALTGNLDTSLFLFTSAGLPVYANDDAPGGGSVGSTLPAGNAFGPQSTGLYYLAISLSGSDAVNFANQLLFMSLSSTSVRGPNPSANGALSSWDSSLANGSGTTFPAGYQIDLTGASTAVVPEPSALALLLAGSLGLLFVGCKRRRRLALLPAIALGVASALAANASADSVPQNLGNGLGQLVESNVMIKSGHTKARDLFNGYATEQAARYAAAAITDGGSRVMVRINFAMPGRFEKALAQVKSKIPSLTITASDPAYRGVGVSDAYVSVDDVPALAKLPAVRSVILEIKPIVQRAASGKPGLDATVDEVLTKIGTAFDQGVTQHRVDQINQYYNSSATQDYEGTGMTIGCLSDSFGNRTTGNTATIDVNTNFDLPGSPSNPVNTMPVVVLQDYTGSGTDEGRGMVQITHKMAPKARLGFATAYFGTVGFGNNIRALAGLTGFTYPNQSGFAADVICDDVSYVDEPWFQDGEIGRAVNDVSAHGVSYFSSSGNNPGITGYQSDFRYVPNGTGTTAGSNSALVGTNINLANVPPSLYQGGFHNFNPNPGQQDVAQTVNVPANNGNPFVFEWDDPFDQPSNLVFDTPAIYTNSGTYTTAPVTFNDLPTLTAGQEYVIKEVRTSGTFDGQIGVYDANGMQVAFQDNSTDETMQFFPPATGHYTLIITQDAGTGNFDVNVYTGHDAPAGITSDFNVLVFDMNGNYLPNSSMAQNNVASNEAVEFGFPQRAAGQTQIQFVLSRSFIPTAPNPASHLRYLFFGNGAGGLGPAEYFDYLASVTGGHNTAATANGVAAYSVFRPSLPESFTSPGPVTAYFDDNGNRLAMPQLRLQPTVAAADAGNTSFFTNDSGSDPDTNANFSGTSAAAPHAAAIAALVLQSHGGSGSVTPAQMTTLLERSGFQHDLDPYAVLGSARTSNGAKVNIAIHSDSDSNAGTGGNDVNSFEVSYIGPSNLTSLTFNPGGTAATAGNVSGGNNGVINVAPAPTPATVTYFENSFPGMVFTPATRAFALGTLTGLTASDVTAPSSTTPFTGFSNLAGAPSNGTSQFYTMTLNFPTSNFTGGKVLRFTVGRAVQHSASTAGAAPYPGTTATNYIADLFGGGVILPNGTVMPDGMTFSGTTGDGGTFSGVFRNRIGNGYSSLDGFGFINAQTAVNAPLP